MPPISSEQQEQLRREVDLFLHALPTQPADVDMLRSYLRHRPRSVVAQRLVPEGQIEERLALGRKMDAAI